MAVVFVSLSAARSGGEVGGEAGQEGQRTRAGNHRAACEHCAAPARGVPGETACVRRGFTWIKKL